LVDLALRNTENTSHDLVGDRLIRIAWLYGFRLKCWTVRTRQMIGKEPGTIAKQRDSNIYLDWM